MPAALTLEHITKTFRVDGGTFTALNDICFSLEERSCTVIGGANGSGKSLLMSIIAGLETPDSGKVLLSGNVGLVFQDADAQILGETPREDVAFGPINQKLPQTAVAEKTAAALAETGLSEKADFPSRFLSGGEKRRLAAAGILAMDSPIVIFDEPYANLDYGGVKQVNALIRRLHKSSHTVVILTHELEKCLGMADRFIVLYRGAVVFDGTAQQGLMQPLESWSIRNPLVQYTTAQDLLWE
ncbi:MAG TPA: energy-coupling factor ABC transporter ATP-binding protein [Candidatus Treponema faecavium]|nr:energy-coupling factor ABC transporter ATP-binding protein [Candidatus Treponema faecavium]